MSEVEAIGKEEAAGSVAPSLMELAKALKEKGYFGDLVDAVVRPLSDPFEEEIEEHPDFDTISDELMKRGTLAHASINWGIVEESSLKLLQTAQKDISLLEALFLSRLSKKTRFAFASCVLALDAYCSLPKELRFPKDVKRFTLLLKRTTGLLTKDSPPGQAGKENAVLLAAIESLMRNEAIVEQGLTKGLRELRERLQLEEQERDKKEQATKASGSDKADREKVGSGGGSTQISSRTLKKSIGDVSGLIFELAADTALPYQLFRFGSWYDITNPPPIRTKNASVIPAVSVDTIDRYQSLLQEEEIDRASILKLERTLFSMPFWIEGHYIAAQIAEKCGHFAVKDAIHASTSAFIERLPKLHELCFENGSPFIPGEVAIWLNDSPQPKTEITEESSKPSWGLTELAENRKMTSRWNGDYKKFRSPRQKAFMELELLEMLSKAGLSSLVSDQAKRLFNSAEQSEIKTWDPEFFGRTSKIITEK
ncbi:type VI secretion system domain-containing protein [Flexibacterium corallicola]|uniref:type VI secretion system domain-containing protein n=1 Tax=Flexibacterium corallicola TaxID=3037259 RepID=UPI00286EFB63|nr:type VI secretion system domain-containing protein [Pseudovibrio sp. M1P-2-3]